MNFMWDETALNVESVPNIQPESVGSYLSGATELLPLNFAHWGESSTEADEANVGQWLTGIGQGAATGAATGAAAGPWGALIGGLVGGGLGAAQTAMAPKQSPAPAPRRAQASPPQSTQHPRSPLPSTPHRSATGQAKSPTKSSGSGPAASGTSVTSQLLDQLATLVPVVAALAVQVGQLTQAAQAGIETNEEQVSPTYQESDHEHMGEAADYGESGENAFEEGSWPENLGGEWLGSEDRSENETDM